MILVAIALMIGFRGDGPEKPSDLAALVAAAGTDASARENAAGRLEEIGRDALPALRAARSSAGDAASARRVSDLIDLIERKRLLRATLVDIDVKDVPIADAAATLAARSGFAITVADPDAKAARVSLRRKAPAGFWDVLDRLAAAAGMVVGGAGGGWPPSHGPSPSSRAVTLTRGEPSPIAASLAGPYRVDLKGLALRRQVTQPRAGMPPARVESFTATVRLMAEPGLAIERNGSPHIQEAAADSGEDLRPTWSSSAGSPGYGMNLGRRWAAEACELDYALSLSLPAARPGVIRRLRGYLPIMALARTGPLLDTPIAGCEGTSHVVGETTLTVRAVNRVGGRVHAMTIQIRNDPSVAPTSPTIAAGPRQATLAPVTPRFFAADHVQLIDEKGRPCSITINQPPARPDGSLDLTITVGRDPAAGDPARIRYFGIVAELTEVPFLFEAVPIP